MNDRVLIFIKLFFVEIVVVLVGQFRLVLLPDRNHTVQRFQLGMVFVFVLRSLFEMRMCAEHLDRIADIIRIFLYQAFDFIVSKVFAELFVVRIVLYIKRDFTAADILFKLLDIISVNAL